ATKVNQRNFWRLSANAISIVLSRVGSPATFSHDQVGAHDHAYMREFETLNAVDRARLLDAIRIDCPILCLGNPQFAFLAVLPFPRKGKVTYAYIVLEVTAGQWIRPWPAPTSDKP